MHSYQEHNASDRHLDRGIYVNRLYYDEKYSSEHGATDIYPSIAAMVRDAIKKDSPFVFEGRSQHSDTLRYRIERTPENYRLTVSNVMDSDEELIADAIHALDRSDDILSVEERESILDHMYTSDISGESEVEATLPLTSGYDAIMEKFDQLWREVEGSLEKQFEQVKDMVKGYLVH